MHDGLSVGEATRSDEDSNALAEERRVELEELVEPVNDDLTPNTPRPEDPGLNLPSFYFSPLSIPLVSSPLGLKEVSIELTS